MSKPRVPVKLRRSVWTMLRDGIEPGLIAFHTGVKLAAIKRMQYFMRLQAQALSAATSQQSTRIDDVQ